MSLITHFEPHSPMLRSACPLTDERLRSVVPSIFAENRHPGRSPRYSHIPTAAILSELRKEGFFPFMACQSRVRSEDRREYTKHMLRLRHANQNNGEETSEIILINSHDGASRYQMLAGMFLFVCSNGLVSGDTFFDVRVSHRGDVAGQVIEGAYDILKGFDAMKETRDTLRAIQIDDGEAEAFARAALILRYGEDKPSPITARQILEARRSDDDRSDLWAVFNRTQENLIKGGLPGRSANGRMCRTRPIQGIDQNLRLNRALWQLAEEMRRLKA